MKVNLQQLFRYQLAQWQSSEDNDEKESILYWVFEHQFKASRADIMTGKMTTVDRPVLSKIMDRLHRHEPIQYIIGECTFLGRNFFVDLHVLIPRPETEWLTQEIILQFKNEKLLNILDIGTGSGCIAITLCKKLSCVTTFATDKSVEALEVAKKNAISHQAAVQFYEHDILIESIPFHDLDIIVSNPPYILDKEKSTMKTNVLDYEPSLALFVPNDDPLLFYRQIVLKSMNVLRPQGWIFTEINEKFGQTAMMLFKNAGFIHTKITKDIFGKDRMISGQKP